MSETTVECYCDADEYAPCENHGTVLMQREGAALRTSDELALCFLSDAEDICPGILTPYAREVMVLAALATEDESWIQDENLSQALNDLVRQVESYGLGDGITVTWSDGYLITQITGGPLLDD